jgi:PGF-pre-PGF domain-containing protein
LSVSAASAEVMNLGETDVDTGWINWNWTNPEDSGFSYVMVYLDTVFVTNTSSNFYNATGLTEGTTYTISTRTVDINGTINSTWVNDSATTAISADITPPASVTNLEETEVGTEWINWNWTNPDDIDFSHVMVYLDAVFVTNTSNNFYNSTGFAEGTMHTISTRTVDSNGNINSTWVNDSAITETPADTTPPASVTNLEETEAGTEWINWNWTNPDDIDFSHVMVYLDAVFVTNTSNNFYNSTGFAEGTMHTISTRTVDSNGNINSTWVNDSAITETPADTTPPASVTNFGETDTGPSWISWNWTNPDDPDFSHVMVYLNGAFVTNTSDNSINSYNATGLAEGVTYNIGTHTVDTSGNINATWVNDSAITETPADTTPPASVTNLGETEVGTGWINWQWTNPDDPDFSHVMVYLDTVFVTNTSGSVYNSTGLEEETTHTVSTRTVDINGNINSTWVNDSAITLILPEISSLSGTNITKTSITLVWEASDDTTRVKISRDDVVLGNVSGSSFYVDNNLSSGTTYTYTLIPYNEEGVSGNSVSVSLTTRSGSSGGGSGGSSSGGGGGGAASVEDFSNLALKEIDSKYLRMNSNVVYEFTTENNPVQSISLYSLKNSGEITSTIEVLNNRSKLVDATPEQLIYRYINIWIGKTGFATAANIKDAHIKFKVNSSWVRQMGVSPSDIRLLRYNGTAWEVLPTVFESNITDYAIFESQTPGFSPFAITAEKAVVSSATADITPIQTEQEVENTGKDTLFDNVEDIGLEKKQPEDSGTWTLIIVFILIGVLAVGYEYLKKQDT